MNNTAFTVLICGAVALAACDQNAERTVDEGAAAPAATPSLPSHADGARAEVGDTPADEPVQLSPDARKGEEGARAVLLAWARALERKDFAAARSLFEDSEAQDYAERLAPLDTIVVAAPAGQMEGAAGSLYYIVTVTVTGTGGGATPVQLQGPVVLQRANDVPGATSEQLRWRIRSAELKPLG